MEATFERAYSPLVQRRRGQEYLTMVLNLRGTESAMACSSPVPQFFWQVSGTGLTCLMPVSSAQGTLLSHRDYIRFQVP